MNMITRANWSTLFLFSLALLCSHSSFAQCDPILLPDTLQYVTNGKVNAMKVSGNTLYIGGDFNAIGHYSGGFVKVDTAEGAVMNRATWPKVNGTVEISIPDNKGGWIIGGYFSMVGDSVRNNIAQIDSNGAVTSFSPNVDNVVYALALKGNTLYVGGMFKLVNGISRKSLAKIYLSTGGLDPIWNPGTDNYLRCLSIYGDKVYGGGFFTSAGGQPRQSLAAFDTIAGVVTPWNPNADRSGLTPAVYTIAFDANGKAYIGGDFVSVGALACQGLARVDTSTGIADSWAPALSGGTPLVSKILINPSTVYVGGYFTKVDTAIREGFAEIDKVTGLCTPFAPMRGGVLAMALDLLQVGGKLFIVGERDNDYGTKDYKSVVKVDIASGRSEYLKNCDDIPLTINYRKGALFIGGAFTMVDSRHRRDAAAIDLKADTITAWAVDIRMSAINSIEVSPTRVYIGGDFWAYDTIINDYVFYIASTDPVTGQMDTAFSNVYLSSNVTHMLYDKGDLFIAGFFGSIGGYTRNNIAKVSATSGKLDVAWNPGSYSDIVSIDALQQEGNNLIMGGHFDIIDGVNRMHLCSVDKTTGKATSWDPSLSDPVTSLAINNGKLYVGGYFDSVSHIYLPKLARIDIASSKVEAWSPKPDNNVNVITPYYNMEFAAGHFYNIGGAAIAGLGAVNDNSNGASTWNPAPVINGVKDMAVYEHTLYVAGVFDTISGRKNIIGLAKYRIQTEPDTMSITGGPLNICHGSSSSFTATALPGSSFQWYVNGATASSTTSTFTYTPANGDMITCTATPPTGACYTTDSAVSNSLTVSYITPITPSVSLSALPLTVAGEPVTVKATISGTGGSYQADWYLNGSFSSTTTTPSFTFTKGSGEDAVYVVVKPLSAGCYDSTKSASAYADEKLGASLISEARAIKVYPDPFVDQLTISGLEKNDKIRVFDVNGRKRYETTRANAKQVISLSALPAGVYFIAVFNEQENAVTSVSVRKEK